MINANRYFAVSNEMSNWRNVYPVLIIQTVNKNILDPRQIVTAASAAFEGRHEGIDMRRKSADTKRPPVGIPGVYMGYSMRRSETRGRVHVTSQYTIKSIVAAIGVKCFRCINNA